MKWRSYLVAILIIAGASVIRVVFFGGLGRGTAYLTYYPTVMLAALYGGLHSCLLATAIAALLCFFWIQKGYMSPVESMAIHLIGRTNAGKWRPVPMKNKDPHYPKGGGA